MTSAFIIQVQPQLQKDPNEETASLLRVLIHKIDNTTFGGDVPSLPQWTGPARMAVQVQSILYASLAASLFSAFLAMLGKQWLNRYASIDMRGSAIERSQDRQRKLDGIVRWYFNHVLESLPLMLQVALLLLGCALSRYLWDINTAIASVVVGVTSFGVLFYLFIIAAGVISNGCPYQTPWTSIIRHLLHLFVKNSIFYVVLSVTWRGSTRWHASLTTILSYPLWLLAAFTVDALRFGRATFRPLVLSVRRAYRWLSGTSPTPTKAFDYQETESDFRCISWILRTSLDKTINLSTLKFLRTILTLPGFNPDIILDCFNIFSSCFVPNYYTPSITRGSEQLAEISAMCFFCAFSPLLIVEPTPTIVEDVRQRYKRLLPHEDDLDCSSADPLSVNVVHRLFPVKTAYHTYMGTWPPYIDWASYNPSLDELVPFAHALAQVAQFKYRSGDDGNRKVPRWLIRFAFRFLSRDPLPPAEVVVDCLTIIATDLGCDVSSIHTNTSNMIFFGKCVHTPKTTVSPLTLH